MAIKPIGDRVLIKTVPKKEKTASGLVLPESAKEEKKEQGEILALGNGEKVKNSELEIGQTIMVGGWPKEIKQGEETFKVVEFDDVLAILN